jgi:hypothetical protein
MSTELLTASPTPSCLQQVLRPWSAGRKRAATPQQIGRPVTSWRTVAKARSGAVGFRTSG